MLQYHHCRSLDSAVYGRVEASPEHADQDFKDAYSWLEKEVGFYPLFLAVGTTDEDIRMTGYQNQWRKILSDGPNDVLFSFEKVEGVFMDYGYWHLVLNSSHKNYQMTDYEKRLIFKPSWPKLKWLKNVEKKPSSVQLVTRSLHLPDAKRVRVRNQQTKKLLEFRGFENVEVRRIILEEPDRY